MENKLYRRKGRLGNPETYMEIIEKNGKLRAINYFQGGTIFEEDITLEEIADLKKKKLLTKANSIAWKKEGEECQKKPTRKKSTPKVVVKKRAKATTPKKVVTKKPVPKKSVTKTPVRKKSVTKKKKMVPIEVLLKKSARKTLTT
ncbi:MAG: hypothetical protein DRJ01_11160 [Bacteroidetes bacterium]|nr:MAG: hypothetical protein DRJ01_11160 [Bacteroidota bacterium]